MVAPLFGWSAGDVIIAIHILHEVSEAFRDAGGAQEQYAETATWLSSFATLLERLQAHTGDKSNSKYSIDIQKWVVNIGPQYFAFERYLQKYDSALSSRSDISRVKTAFRQVKWALKELKGHVDHLKVAVSTPLESINLLLNLQIL